MCEGSEWTGISCGWRALWTWKLLGFSSERPASHRSHTSQIPVPPPLHVHPSWRSGLSPSPFLDLSLFSNSILLTNQRPLLLPLAKALRKNLSPFLRLKSAHPHILPTVVLWRCLWRCFKCQTNRTINTAAKPKGKVKVAQSCQTLRDPMGCSPGHGNSPGQNTGVGSLSLLQGIFPSQGLNPGLPHWWGILYQLSHKGGPIKGRTALLIGGASG